MIKSNDFLNFLKKKNISFFCGVPDSCVAPLIKKINPKNNFVLANEGLAVSFGIGYHLATKKIPLIYLQNSGLGNATDPLTNLANKEVYGIPLVLLIGWRGYPTIKDEPQHIIQGKVLKNTLKSYNIPNVELKNKNSYKKINKLILKCKEESRTVAILVNNKTFDNSDKNQLNKKHFIKTNLFYRRDYLSKIIINTKITDKIVSSVGYNSREIYQLLKNLKIKRKIFYLIGGMGHTASLALAHNIFQKKRVITIDGDGSFLMHLGSLVHCGNLSNNNFKYILFQNKSHESVGNIKMNYKIDYKKFSASIGFREFIEINNVKNFDKKIKDFLISKKNSFMVINTKVGTFKNLLRIKELDKIKKSFI